MLPFPWTLLFGCALVASETDTVTDPAAETSADTSEAVPGAVDDHCDVRIIATAPESEAIGVATTTPIVLTFDAALPTQGWTFEAAGVEGRVTVDAIAHTLRFDPTPSWPGDTEVRWQFEGCGAEHEGRFHTTGAPILADALEDLHWEIDAQALSWGEPAIASVFLPLLPPWTIDLSFEPGIDGQHLWLSGEVDEVCFPAVDLGRVDWATNPSFGVGPTEVRSGDILLFQAMLLGSFDAALDLRTFGFSALLDTRMLAGLLPGVSLCDVALQFGEPCQPCPDGIEACVLALATLNDRVEAEARETEPACDEVQRRLVEPEAPPNAGR
jgi:hypothetical protein